MSELMKRRKTLTEPEVRYYMVQIVQALKFLHNNLIIHRDLKLGNLFIDHDMRVKLGDFGLATKLTHANERKRTVCGTPNYIAPEILESKDGHSFEVDIWSSGVLVYTLLFGKPPFESKDVKSTYKRILQNSYVFPEHSDSAESGKHLIRAMLQVCTAVEVCMSCVMVVCRRFRSNGYRWTTSCRMSSSNHPPTLPRSFLPNA